MMKKTWTLLGLLLIFTNFPLWARELNSGPWRFELKATHATIPFVIDFHVAKDKTITAKLHNGKETIPLKDIILKDDHLSIPLQTYEISLELQLQDNALMGDLVRHNKNPEQKTPVSAVPGIKQRFTAAEKRDKPTINLTGKWSFELEDEKGIKSVGVGNFKQKGSYLTGSILTPTGDYRYLEGYVSGKTFEAASFDGVYNYLFKGKVDSENHMNADILSNTKTAIKGNKNPKAELPDAYKQTEISTLKFTFPDLKGTNISLDNPKFKNKPVIVQIYGSWCPNCLDEMNYLIPWYRQNAKRGIEVVALAFERSLDQKQAQTQLLKVQQKLKIPYTILQAGSTSEDKPAEKIEGLKNFISFPTMIFLNRKHEVVKVHAGFTGPSTGSFYEHWKKEFNQTVNQLLK